MNIGEKKYRQGKIQVETSSGGDVITSDGECLFRSVTGGTEIFYKPAEGASCTISLGTRRAQIDMKGEMSYRFKIEPETDYPAVIKTQYGKMDITVRGGDMLVKPFKDGLEAVIRYALMNGGEVVTENTMALRVKFDKDK